MFPSVFPLVEKVIVNTIKHKLGRKAPKDKNCMQDIWWHFPANLKPTFWNGLTNPDEGICKTVDECDSTSGNGALIEWIDRKPFDKKDFMTSGVRFDKGLSCSVTRVDADGMLWAADDPAESCGEENAYVCEWSCEEVTTTTTTITTTTSTTTTHNTV